MFVLVRLPLLTTEASARGWNGDSAIFGLMAKKIHDGKGFDVFFWGQNYMGPLTPALAAAIRKTTLDPAGVGVESGPIALRLASMCEIALGICLYFIAFTRLFGWAIAAAAGLWMALGPPFFIRLSALNRSGLGPEMSFALGSVLFLLAASALTRSRPLLDRRAGLFVLGLLGGLGWWMNQTIAFVFLPVAALVLFRSPPVHGRAWARLLTLVLGGFVLGYSPVWLGRLLGWYDAAEGPVVTPWLWDGLPARLVRFLGTDCWEFVGLQGLLPPPFLGALALVPLWLLLRRLRRLWRSLGREAFRFEALDLVGAIVAFGAVVSFFKSLSPAGDRYLAPALPAVLALLLVSIAEAMGLLRRRVPPGLVMLLSGGLAVLAAVFLFRQARGVVDGLLLEPDPRAPLRAIAEGGYTVCHAGYDASYTLQFLSDERVRFIPFHSPDRNRKLSAELRRSPEPHCLVAADGSVRRWLPSDAAQEGGPARQRGEKR